MGFFPPASGRVRPNTCPLLVLFKVMEVLLDDYWFILNLGLSSSPSESAGRVMTGKACNGGCFESLRLNTREDLGVNHFILEVITRQFSLQCRKYSYKIEWSSG